MVAAAGTAGVVVALRTFVVQVYGISTPSMVPTLLPGDFVVSTTIPFGRRIPGTRWSTPRFRNPRRGEVVVYGEGPGEVPVRIIKRVIGAPGDTVGMVAGTVIRNGNVLEEPFVSPVVRDDEPLPLDGPYGVAWHRSALPSTVAAETYRPSRDHWGPLVVPPDHYLVLGDDRDGSRDSRVTGFVHRARIRGTVLAVYFSVEPGPSRFPRALRAARWARLGRRVQ